MYHAILVVLVAVQRNRYKLNEPLAHGLPEYPHMFLYLQLEDSFVVLEHESHPCKIVKRVFSQCWPLPVVAETLEQCAFEYNCNEYVLRIGKKLHFKFVMPDDEVERFNSFEVFGPEIFEDLLEDLGPQLGR